MIPLNGEQTWVLHFNFNINVDYCIWILEFDGLQVPPFNHHPDGNGVLRERGLDASSWRGWLEKVVFMQDQRLNWHVEDIKQSTSEKISSFQSMEFANDKITPNLHDREQLQTVIERQLVWEEQQYQKAFKLAEVTSRFKEPADVWTGEPAVGQLLGQIWQIYLSKQAGKRRKVYLEKERKFFQNKENKDNSQKLSQNLNAYLPNLDILQIYLVDYPALIEYTLPPASGILSIKNGLPYTDSFCQSVLCIADKLTSRL